MKDLKKDDANGTVAAGNNYDVIVVGAGIAGLTSAAGPIAFIPPVKPDFRRSSQNPGRRCWRIRGCRRRKNRPTWKPGSGNIWP